MTINLIWLIWMAVILVMAFLLQVTVLCFKTARSGGAYRLVISAADAGARGDPETSMRLYESAVARAPMDAAIISHHAAALYRAGRSSEAETGFRRALELENDLVAAHYGLGHLLLDSSPTAAAENFSVVIAREPNSANGWHGRALARLRFQRIDQALADFQEAMSRNPRSDSIAVNFGVAQVLHGNFDEAEKLFRSAIKINPQSGEAFANLGDLLALGKRFSEAADAMETAFKLGEESIENRLELAHVLRQLGRNDEARIHLEKIVEAEPKNENALYQLALLYHRSGEKEKAGKMADRAEALDARLKGDGHVNIENIAEYAKLTIFAGLPEEDIRRLVSVGKRRQLAEREVLADAGAHANSFFIIEDGNIAVKAADNPDVTLADIGRGEVIGEVAFYDPRERTAALVARTSARVLEISFAALDVFLEEKPRSGQIILRNIGKIMGNRLRIVDSQVCDKITWNFSTKDSL